MSPEPDVLMGSLAEEYSPPTQGGEPDDFEGVADHYGISEDVEMRAPEPELAETSHRSRRGGNCVRTITLGCRSF